MKLFRKFYFEKPVSRTAWLCEGCNRIKDGSIPKFYTMRGVVCGSCR